MGDEVPTRPDAAPRRSGTNVSRWFAALGVLLLVGAIGFAIGYAVTPPDDASDTASSQPAVPGGGGSAVPTSPRSPAESELANAGLRQSDLREGVSIVLIPGGGSPSGGPTLDLCNGDFPSESERRARIQVAAIDTQGNVRLSTEAVQYTDAEATEQAFEQLRSVAASCPNTPVDGRDGEEPVTTRFRAAPDRSWPHVDGVDRLAYEFDTTTASGDRQRSIAVYLRRGRVLLGVYFPHPDAQQTAVAGQSTVEGVVNMLEQRVAELPDSLVQN
jgi:hypothetical protein